MSILETLISSIAPHECFVCSQQGSPLCEICALEQLEPLPPRCFRCLKRTPDFRVCTNCRRLAPLKSVWPASEYSKAMSDLIRAYKFGRVRALARPLAVLLDDSLPYFNRPPTVVHVPTVPARVRARGYDQSLLLARQLAKIRGWQQIELLRRVGVQRQVGANRQTRLDQLSGAFRAIRPVYIKGNHILLVDDVVTTGATLSAAAKTLKSAGAKSVSAVVLAHKS